MFFLLIIGFTGFCSGASVEDNERDERVLLSVVRFDNDPCGADSGLNGTCLASSECSTRGGTASGSCASGYGVCCTLKIDCGATTSTNNTYLEQAQTTTSATCTYTICPISTDICQIRIDFEKFVMAAASTTTGKKGLCDADTMVISNPSGPNPPIFCGIMTGQHMYIEASTSCHTMMTTIGSLDTTTSREWSMRVSQIECSSDMVAPGGCLQYYTGTTGYLYNFGWSGTSVLAASAATAYHQNNQNYNICIRKEEGYCSVEYWATNFAISANANAGQALYGDSCTEDYVTIPGLKSTPATVATDFTTAVGDRVCGLGWKYPADSAPALTLVSFTKPFSVGVNFDSADETSNDSQEGFAILFTQKTCS